MNKIFVFLITFVIFIVLDLIWLGFVAKSIYNHWIGFLMTDNIRWEAAIIFYIIFIIGMLFFVINPAIEKGSIVFLCKAAFLYGFVTYSTYELTNLAVIESWPVTIVFIDIAWGSILSLLTSVLTYKVVDFF